MSAIERALSLMGPAELVARVVELAGLYAGPAARIDVGGWGAGDAIADALAAQPGATRRAGVHQRAGEEPIVIASVELQVGAVTIAAQWSSRPATADEAEALRRDAAHDSPRYRSARLP